MAMILSLNSRSRPWFATSVAAAVGATEQPGCPAERDAGQRPFCRWQIWTVVEEAGEPTPCACTVAVKSGSPTGSLEIESG